MIVNNFLNLNEIAPKNLEAILEDANKLKKADTINAIVFAHKDDTFEDPKTLSFFEKFKNLNFIDYSELKPTSCTWADVNEKMTADKGHNIPQSKCFTKYLDCLLYTSPSPRDS